MKKTIVIFIAAAAAAVAGLFIYRLGAPEVRVANFSGSTILEVTVSLPSNRLSFGSIPDGSESTIYYSSDQGDGLYQYTVSFKGAPDISGSCGYVTNSEYGKRLDLTINSSSSINCREVNKIF